MYMKQPLGLGRWLFAAGMIGLGVLGLIYDDFALVWQRVPTWVPWREGLAYACGAAMLASGIGLLWTRTARLASEILLVYLLLWFLLKVPRVAIEPSVADAWGQFGENAVLLAGGLVLFNSIRFARIIFGIALPLCGLTHFAYADVAANFVPPWLPWHLGWVYLTGFGFVAAGAGVLFGIYTRLAAMTVAGMMGVFTLLVWLPSVVGSSYGPALSPDPSSASARFAWTGFLISWSITAAAWVVADSYREVPWLAASRAWLLPTRHAT
jgi:uncharacterized membrane protein